MELGKPSLIYSVCSFFSKVITFVRDIFIAAFFGAGITSDIFFLALKIPTSFERSVSGQTFNSAYIPIFLRLHSSKNENEIYDFTKNLLKIICLFFIPFVVLIVIFMPLVVRVIAPGITDEDDFSLLVQISRIIFPYLFFIASSSVFIGILNANNKFALSALLPVFLNITLIVFILLSPNFENQEIVFISWGVLAGGLLQLCFLFFSVKKRFWENFLSTSSNQNTKKFFTLFWPTFTSSTFMQINLIVSLMIASFEESAVSYIYFADRVCYIPLTLVAVAISTVLIPNITKLVKSESFGQAKELQEKAFRYLLLTIVPLGAFIFSTSDEIVSLLYERGEFDAVSAKATSEVLKFFLLGLPAMAATTILMPYFFAIQRPKIPLKISIITVSMNVVFTITLFNFLGFLGIPLAFSISSWINAILMYIEHKKLNFFRFNKGLILYSIRYILFSFLLVIVLSYISSFLQELGLSLLTETLLTFLNFLILLLIFVYFFDKKTYSELLKEFF